MSTEPISQQVEQLFVHPKRSGKVSDSNSLGQSEKYSEKPEPVPAGLISSTELFTENGNVITKDGVVISTQESKSSLSSNIFSDPEVKVYYIDVYEQAEYEYRHIFNTDLQWSKEEEKALARKLDWQSMTKVSHDL